MARKTVARTTERTIRCDEVNGYMVNLVESTDRIGRSWWEWWRCDIELDGLLMGSTIRFADADAARCEGSRIAEMGRF